MHENRWEAIASSIKGAIRRGELYAGARIASETELAAQWKVSPMTVHRALAELQREGWVVRRPRAGTLVADRSILPVTNIGLTVTSPSDYPQAGYARGIEEGLGDGYRLVTYSTHGTAAGEARCLERAAAECGAVICYPTGAPENTPLLNKLAANLPLVFIDCEPDGIEADVVSTDNRGSMVAGLRHLHALGHSRIAYFMGHMHNVSSQKDRYAGYREFMLTDIGMEDPDRLVRRFSLAMPVDHYFDSIEAIVADLLDDSEPVTAIACQQDSFMAAVLEACIHLGVSVPGELAILSFNDVSVHTLPLGRTVHRLVQRPLDLGHMAALRVKSRLDDPGLPVQDIRLMASLYPATVRARSDVAKRFIESRLSRLNKPL